MMNVDIRSKDGEPQLPEKIAVPVMSPVGELMGFREEPSKITYDMLEYVMTH